MKKEYRRPDIVFESFALSANIAGGCVTSMGASVLLGSNDTGCSMYGTKADGNSCYIIDNGTSIFMSSTAGCMVTPDDDGTKDDYYFNLCYHVPSEGNKLFGS